jgi:LPS export ABC transporter protein LptC
MGRSSLGRYFLCLFLLVALCACRKIDTISFLDFDGEPDSIIYDFTFTSSVSTNKVWECQCKEAEVYNEARKYLFKDIVLHLYERNKPQSVLTARYGIMNKGEQNITAKSNVVLITVDKSRLYTESLSWDDQRKLLTTEEFVRIVRANGDVITGIGMEMDKNADEIVIKHKVKGTSKQNEKNSKNSLF